MKTAGVALPTAMAFGGPAKNTIPYKRAAAAAAVKKKDAIKALAPARSALVKQRAAAGKNILAPLKGDASKLHAGVKDVLGQDKAKLTKATAPGRAMASKEAAGVKNVLGRDKKAALQALAPAKSALVKARGQAATDLAPAKANLKRLGGGVKDVLGQDKQKIKQATAPAAKWAGEKKDVLKRVGADDKKAALKALAPAKSALVKARGQIGKDLAPIKSTIGKDLGILKTGAKKDIGSADQAVKISKAGRFSKKMGQKVHKSLYGTP